MNLSPRGKQPQMSDRWDYQDNLLQFITLDKQNGISELQGQPKR
jgi:hypothetical protein